MNRDVQNSDRLEQNSFTPTAQRQNPFIIPIAILIGFAMIASAIFFSGVMQSKSATIAMTPTTQTANGSKTVRPVTAADHIQGNPNAPIMIVEYSDYDCPFCKEFHDTMTQIMSDYGASGKVAWVWRQFPLSQLHPNAPRLALASECIASLGGNDAFWKFTDIIYNSRDINSFTNMTQLPDYVTQAGVDNTAFNKCMTDGTFQKNVDADIADGTVAGAQGTPYSLVLVGNQQGVINGAQSYATVKQIIDTLIGQLDGTGSSTAQ